MTGTMWAAQAAVVAGVVATAGFATLGGQAERPASSELKALVEEVRALRLSIERTSTHTSQAQLLLGRVQLQENRLATLGRQYQEARARSLDAQADHRDGEARLVQLTESLRAATGAEHRQALEDGIAQLKRELAGHQARAEQLRSDEAGALDALTTEQHRWSDFNQRLEALERALSGVG
jgi:chromosome segregation protein